MSHLEGNFDILWAPENPMPPGRPVFNVAEALCDLLVKYDTTDSLSSESALAGMSAGQQVFYQLVQAIAPPVNMLDEALSSYVQGVRIKSLLDFCFVISLLHIAHSNN